MFLSFDSADFALAATLASALALTSSPKPADKGVMPLAFLPPKSLY